jgi:hypothetical protein
MPLDLAIVYLGTNDLADRYCLSAADVAEACASLVKIVRFAECGRDGAAPPGHRALAEAVEPLVRKLAPAESRAVSG